MIQAYQVATRGIYKALGLVRSRRYRQWIKSLPCLVCGTWRNVDPCHTGGHGLSVRSSDLTCLPLCRKHHDEYHQGHKDFAIVHGLNIEALVKFHNHLWVLREQRRTR